MPDDQNDSLVLYREYSGWMQNGDLIEWSSYGSAIGFLIRKITRRDVNHSSILLRPKEYAGLKDRRILLEALNGGLVPRLLSLRLSKYHGRVWWYPLDEDKVSEEQRTMMMEWTLMEVLKGKRYDFESLFANAVGRVSVNADKWFCSEAYTAMLMSVNLVPKDTKALRPGEFGSLNLHTSRVMIYDSKLFQI